VIVNAENLLNDDDAALRRALRIGAIGPETVFIRGSEREMLTQDEPPNVDASMISKSGNRFPACAKPFRELAFSLEASAGESRSDKIMLRQASPI
jgi:hypothetical protein